MRDVRGIYNAVVVLADAGRLDLAQEVFDLADEQRVPVEIKGGTHLARLAAEDAIEQAELAALKAQNADLLKALHNLTENVVFYHRNGISDLKDAKADRNNAVKIALIAIGIEADPDLEFSDWQPSPAIAKARGES